MELSVSFRPLGNTTEREIVVLTREVYDVLFHAPGVEKLGPVFGEAPGGAKGGIFEVVGSFLLSATPEALKQLLPMLKDPDAPRAADDRSGHPGPRQQGDFQVRSEGHTTSGPHRWRAAAPPGIQERLRLIWGDTPS
jgi:hypothetical protein